MDTRTALTAYLRGGFYPPLPLVYVDWVESLLDDMRSAVWDVDRGDHRAIDVMVKVPQPVITCGLLPRAAREGDDGKPVVRLGDLISALRLYDHFSEPDTDTDTDES